MPFLRALLLMLVFACAACAPDPAPYDLPDRATPALWKIEAPDGSPGGFLFGTVHLLPRGVEWEGGLVAPAVGLSDRLVLEVAGLDNDANTRRVFRELGTSAGLPPLDQRVPAALRGKLDDMSDEAGVPDFALDRMESWAAALTLASSLHSELRLDRAQGVETKLTGMFMRDARPVSGLETIAEQLGYFDRLPEFAQRRMLRSVVDEAGDNVTEFEALLKAWAAGDIAALAEATQGGMMQAPTLREAILVQRNRVWAGKIDAMLKRGAHPFIAVGAGHLVGTDNLRALLEARGYRVVRVQ